MMAVQRHELSARGVFIVIRVRKPRKEWMVLAARGGERDDSRHCMGIAIRPQDDMAFHGLKR